MAGSKVLQPAVSITLANADAVVTNTDQKVLLVGQKVAAGSAVSGSLVRNLSSSGAPENALFGQNSMLAEMVRAFKRLNQVVQVDAIPLDDAVGTPRLLTLTLSGTATEAGTITIVVGSEELYSFEVVIASGDNEAAVVASIVAAVNADASVLFLAADAAPAVTLTADNDGTVYNDLGFEVSITDASGMTVGSFVETTPGATNPTLTGILDIATDRYQAVVWPYGQTLAVLKTYLDSRENPSNQILDGVGITGSVDSFVNCLADANDENNKNLVYFVDKLESETDVYEGPAQNEASFVKTSYFAAIRALRLTEGASIAQFLTSSASLDQFGGTALASLPYFNTPIDSLPTIASGRGWTDSEIEQLADAGGSVMGVNRTGTGALVGEVFTTFKTDPAGNADVTWEFLNYVDTASNIREYYFNNLKARFAQSRLTEGAVSRGRDMANSSVIRAFVEKLYQDLAGADFVLVQDGEAAIVFFKENLTIVLDLSTGKVTITALIPIVTQLRQIVMTLKIAFSTTS